MPIDTSAGEVDPTDPDAVRAAFERVFASLGLDPDDRNDLRLVWETPERFEAYIAAWQDEVGLERVPAAAKKAECAYLGAFDPSVDYCGPGCGRDVFDALAPPCLNRGCFEHDACYAAIECRQGEAIGVGLSFSSLTVCCDAPLNRDIITCGDEVLEGYFGGEYDTVDLWHYNFVASLMVGFQASELIDSETDRPPATCDESLEDACGPGELEVTATPSSVPYEGTAEICATLARTGRPVGRWTAVGGDVDAGGWAQTDSDGGASVEVRGQEPGCLTWGAPTQWADQEGATVVIELEGVVLGETIATEAVAVELEPVRLSDLSVERLPACRSAPDRTAVRARVTNGDNAPLSGVRVRFVVGGVDLGNVASGADGVAEAIYAVPDESVRVVVAEAQGVEIAGEFRIENTAVSSCAPCTGVESGGETGLACDSVCALGDDACLDEVICACISIGEDCSEFICQCDESSCSCDCDLGERVCTPNTGNICLDNDVVRCSPTGDRYLLVEECDPALGCEAGACVVGACEPGAARCTGETLRECTPEGDREVLTDCAELERYCDDTTLACEPWICAPGELTCDGVNVARCDARGAELVAINTCRLGCLDGACIEGCGDGVIQFGEECDDGNASDDDLCPSSCSCPSNPPPAFIFVDAAASPGGDGSSWGDAFSSLRDALFVVNNRPCTNQPVHVWVAAGRYAPYDGGEEGSPRVPGEGFRLTSGVQLHGGFAGDEDPATFNLEDRDLEANETVLTGDNLANDLPSGVSALARAMCFNPLDPVTVDCADWDINRDGFVTGADVAADARWNDNVTVLSIESTLGPSSTRRDGISGSDNVALSGVTVTGGTPPPNDECYYYDDCGPTSGGVHIELNAEIWVVYVYGNYGGTAGGIGGDGNVSIRDSQIAYNNGGSTGGLAVCGELAIVGTTFVGNTASFGAGALALDGCADARVYGSRFIENHAGGDGLSAIAGAVTLRGDSEFVSTEFIGNRSYGRAGALAAGDGSSTEVVNCTFAHNGATDAASVYVQGTGTSVEVSNSIMTLGVSEDLADPDREAYAAFGGSLTFLRSIVTDSRASGVLVDENVSFVDADGPDGVPGNGDDDLRLDASSGGIDDGATPEVPADVLDWDNDGDTWELCPFDVAGLPRFVDDPAQANGGTPAPGVVGIVDVGAHESQGP